jgi:hypothetical protein
MGVSKKMYRRSGPKKIKDHRNDEAGWDPLMIWTFWKKKRSLAPARIQTMDYPAFSLVTSPSSL